MLRTIDELYDVFEQYLREELLVSATKSTATLTTSKGERFFMLKSNVTEEVRTASYGTLLKTDTSNAHLMYRTEVKRKVDEKQTIDENRKVDEKKKLDEKNVAKKDE